MFLTDDVAQQSVEEECIVEDLMERYAAGETGEEDQILDAMRVDSMKRAVALFRHQQVRVRIVWKDQEELSINVCWGSHLCGGSGVSVFALTGLGSDLGSG